jgi:cytochrome b involved in lipid metabolism
MVAVQSVSLEDVNSHNNSESCWVVISDGVWDVTDFLPAHPGGADGRHIQSHSTMPILRFLT